MFVFDVFLPSRIVVFRIGTDDFLGSGFAFLDCWMNFSMSESVLESSSLSLFLFFVSPKISETPFLDVFTFELLFVFDLVVEVVVVVCFAGELNKEGVAFVCEEWDAEDVDVVVGVVEWVLAPTEWTLEKEDDFQSCETGDCFPFSPLFPVATLTNLFLWF